MTRPDLAAIREAEKEATPGPWQSYALGLLAHVDALTQDCADWQEEYERACRERTEAHERGGQLACGLAFDHGRLMAEVEDARAYANGRETVRPEDTLLNLMTSGWIRSDYEHGLRRRYACEADDLTEEVTRLRRALGDVCAAAEPTGASRRCAEIAGAALDVTIYR